MDAQQALNRIGAHVKDSRQNEKGTSLTLYIRLDQSDSRSAKRWRTFLSKFLTYASRAKSWKVDVSKYFFSKGDDVVFLWRLIISGKVDTALQKVSSSALEALREGVQVTSMPLRQTQPAVDISSGKTKGAHPVGSGESIVSQAFKK